MQDSLWLLTRLYQAGLVTYRITTKGFGFWSTTFPRLDLARQDGGLDVSYERHLLFFDILAVIDKTY